MTAVIIISLAVLALILVAVNAWDDGEDDGPFTDEHGVGPWHPSGGRKP